MPQPLPLKNAISLPFTTTFPFDWPKAYVLPASLIVPALVPRRQTPDSSVGTGPPLGHGSADADGLGEGKLVTVAAVAPAADDAGAIPPPHPPRTKIARTSAPFLIPLLLPPCSRKGREEMLADRRSVPSWELRTAKALGEEVSRSLCSGHPRRQLERLRRSSLVTMRCTWVSAVRSAIPRCAAISLLVSPWATRRATSSSRRVGRGPRWAETLQPRSPRVVPHSRRRSRNHRASTSRHIAVTAANSRCAAPGSISARSSTRRRRGRVRARSDWPGRSKPAAACENASSARSLRPSRTARSPRAYALRASAVRGSNVRRAAHRSSQSSIALG